jgi:hypothetical protein
MKRINSLLIRDDIAGTAFRVLALCLVMGVGLGLSFLTQSLLSIELPSKFLTAAFLIVLFSMTVGLVLSEYPQGVDFTLMRIGFATFCRTGLPLVVVMVVARYSVPAFAGNKTLLFLVAFYAVGLVTSLGLSLYRFSGSSSSSKSQEVDSAAA